MPIFSSPANKIGGKNRIPTAFDAAARPIATPANAANLQVPDSAHRQPRYRASVEKKHKKLSNRARRPYVDIMGEIAQSVMARIPVQFPATLRAKVNKRRPVRKEAIAAGKRTTHGSEEPNTTWVTPRMYFAKKGCC